MKHTLKSNKKTLGNIFILSSIFTITFLATSKKEKKLKINTPTKSQYLNRLFEYFDGDYLDEAIVNYLNLVSMNMEPGDAFEIILGGCDDRFMCS